MKFFNKMVELSEKAINTLEKKSKQVQQQYQEKGLNRLINEGVEQAQKNVDLFTQKLKEKVDDLKQEINKNTKADSSNKTEATPPQKKTSKNLLTKILLDGEILSLDSTPLELVLENLKAQKSRIPGTWTLESGSTISIVHKKWYHFQEAKGGEGAINFLKYVLSGEKSTQSDDPVLDEYLKHDALVLLQQYQKAPNYSQRLSNWIQSEQSFEEKKSSTKRKKTM